MIGSLSWIRRMMVVMLLMPVEACMAHCSDKPYASHHLVVHESLASDLAKL